MLFRSVLVVIAMMAIIVMPLLGMFGSGLMVTQSSRQNLRAANIAQRVLDEIMAGSRTAGAMGELVTWEPGGYTFDLSITSATTKLNKVEITVFSPGVTTPLEVVTLVAKP